jgi:hypothetical protein
MTFNEQLDLKNVSHLLRVTKVKKVASHFDYNKPTWGPTGAPVPSPWPTTAPTQVPTDIKIPALPAPTPIPQSPMLPLKQHLPEPANARPWALTKPCTNTRPYSLTDSWTDTNNIYYVSPRATWMYLLRLWGWHAVSLLRRMLLWWMCKMYSIIRELAIRMIAL